MNQLSQPHQLSDFSYHLPVELIAQHPVEPRDHCRLLITQRSSQAITHSRFYNCIDYLSAGDVVVVNNSKVIPARLFATKLTGGKVEVLLLRQMNALTWECLISGKRPALHTPLHFTHEYKGVVLSSVSDTTWQIRFNKPNITMIGQVPLPPYIREQSAVEQYQTVYATAEGSVAAPTAGLHFTSELLQQLQSKGVIIKEITLHVGLGTFLPIKTEHVSEHTMHAEFASLPEDTAVAIQTAHQQGHKVVAVGTTVARTLEAFTGLANSGWVDIFITPGYTFTTADSLITNFHLPKTTLLMLVAAFMGKDFMDEAYRVAIAERYRFYSFGDAMMIV